MTNPLALRRRIRLAGDTGWSFLAVLLCSGPCTALMFLAVAPVLPAMAARFGSQDGALISQLMMTLPGIGIVIGGPVTGWLTERFGPPRILRVCMAIYAISGAVGLILDAFMPLAVSRFILGVATGGIASTTTTMISQRYEGEARARMFGYQTSVAAAAGVLEILASGAVAEWGGWRAPFALYLVLGIPLLLLTLRPMPGRVQTSAGEGDGRRVPWAAWMTLGAVVLLFAATLMTGAQGAFLLADDGVTSPMLMSMIMVASSAGNAVGAAAFGRCMARIGSARTMVLALLLLATGLALLGTTHTPAWAAPGFLAAGVGSGLCGPWIATRLFERTPVESQARVSGFLISAIFIGDFLNPLMVLPLKSAFGLHGTFVVVAGVLALVAVWTFTGAARAGIRPQRAGGGP